MNDFPVIDEKFIELYSAACTDNMLKRYNVAKSDKRTRAIIAWNMMNTGAPIPLTVYTYEQIVQWWKALELTTLDDYTQMLENYSVVFATNTNRIEGVDISYHNTRDLYETGKVTGYNGTPQDLMAVLNQKVAYDFILSSLIRKTPITMEFILRLHKLMMHGCYDNTRYNKGERPGKFKIHDYSVGLTDEGSLPENVEADLQELIDEIQETNTDDIITVVSYFHLRFESIHPFADGNGRVGRMLLNYQLLLNEYPPTIIFAEDKETYYLALEVFDRTGELNNFIKFIKEQTIKTWSNRVS